VVVVAAAAAAAAVVVVVVVAVEVEVDVEVCVLHGCGGGRIGDGELCQASSFSFVVSPS
jgi:hypothetical protein